MFGVVKNFFRENLSEVIGAYFDGQKIFIVNDGSDVEHLAEKISIASAVGR